jgi:putative hemolysin
MYDFLSVGTLQKKSIWSVIVLGEVPLYLLIIFAALLFLSAFFSSSETALSSANRIRLQAMKDDGIKGADKALTVIAAFDKTLSTILIGNNLVNIAAATISAQISTTIFGPNLGVFISTFVVTLLVLIFGEILPKSLAKEYAESFSIKIAGIIQLMTYVVLPLNWLFAHLKNAVHKMIGGKPAAYSVTEEELKMMVNISEEEGVIEEQEKQLVQRSFDFNEITVEEVLRPRTDMTVIDIEDNKELIKELFIEKRFSRIPVYEGSIDNIIGILHERDFFTAYINGEVNITSLLRKPIIVVESMKVHKLLPKLQREKSHIAIVIDEYGGTSGLITLEDILEELVGEIYDEHDDAQSLVQQKGDNVYLIDGDYSLDEVMKLCGLPTPETSYHSIGGWLSEQFERIPQEGETLDYEGITFKAVEADHRRILSVEAAILEKKEEHMNK